MLSWHVISKYLSRFTSDCHGTCFNELCAWRSFPYLKSEVTDAWKSPETENTVQFELHTFCTFRILARPAAFISTWFHTTLWHHAVEKFCTLQYCKFSTGIYNEVPTQCGPWHIWTSFNWTPSCTHTWEVHNMLGSFFVMWSCELPIHLCLSSSSPIIFGWEFRVCNHHLSPAVTSLVATSFCGVLVLLVLGEAVRQLLNHFVLTGPCVPDRLILGCWCGHRTISRIAPEVPHNRRWHQHLERQLRHKKQWLCHQCSSMCPTHSSCPNNKRMIQWDCHNQYRCETLVRLSITRDQDLVFLPIHELLNATKLSYFQMQPTAQWCCWGGLLSL